MIVLSPCAIREIAQWFVEGDTGSSSETIACIAMGACLTRSSKFSVPQDFADFGRCHRLVERVPELVHHFPVIAKTVPEFELILAAWPELVSLYKQANTDELKSHFFLRLQKLQQSFTASASGQEKFDQPV